MAKWRCPACGHEVEALLRPGAASAPVTVCVHNNAPAKLTSTSRDNADGSRAIDIYIEAKARPKPPPQQPPV